VNEELETLQQMLTAEQQSPLLDRTGTKAFMHGLDELEVLLPDDGAELRDLRDNLVGRIRGPEAVDIGARPLGTVRLEHEHSKIGWSGEGIQRPVRPHVVELTGPDRPVRHIGKVTPVPRLHTIVHGTELAGSPLARGERVGVRVHVDQATEALVRDRTVVALEVVLDHQLPVRLDEQLARASSKLEGVWIEPTLGHDSR